jgi:hypothetical protein
MIPNGMRDDFGNALKNQNTSMFTSVSGLLPRKAASGS